MAGWEGQGLEKFREDANEVMSVFTDQSARESRRERDVELQEELARAVREKRVARLKRLWASLKARCVGS